MNCKSAQIYLSAYLDGELYGQESLEMREHLSGCVECRAEEQQLRSLKQMLRGLPMYAPNQDFEDRLVSTVMQQTVRQPKLGLRMGLDWRMATGLAAAAAIAGFGFIKITERHVPSAETLPVAQRDPFMDITRDQEFMAGNDPLSGTRFVVPTNYGKR